MNITQLRKKIESVNDEAARKLESVAAQLRREKVIPFCNARRLQFLSGMGGFNFMDEKPPGATPDRARGNRYTDDFDMKSDGQWQTLYRLLNEPGGAINANHVIGSYMDDYTPPGWNEAPAKN
jgi:hypothetical protein